MLSCRAWQRVCGRVYGLFSYAVRPYLRVPLGVCAPPPRAQPAPSPRAPGRPRRARGELRGEGARSVDGVLGCSPTRRRAVERGERFVRPKLGQLYKRTCAPTSAERGSALFIAKKQMSVVIPPARFPCALQPPCDCINRPISARPHTLAPTEQRTPSPQLSSAHPRPN